MRNPKSKELVAIVTGGATGIGREVVRQLAELGLAVVVNYHESEDAARRLDAELREQSRQTLSDPRRRKLIRARWTLW